MVAQSPERTVHFDGADLVLASRQRGRERGVITFGTWPVDLRQSLPLNRLRGFGESSFDKLDIDEFHVIPRRNHWYNCGERDMALDLARRFAATRDVITYGSSMGGYGAALFSALLGVPALSISPQFSLATDVAPFEDRWRDDFAQIENFDSGAMYRNGKATGFIFYDPFTTLDAAQAELFRGRSNLTFVPCPFSGHSTVAMINRVYGLGRMALEVLDRRFSVASFMAARRKGRSEDHLYQSLLYIRARSQGRDDLADEMYRNLSAAREKIGLIAINSLFAFAMRRGDRAEAVYWASLAATREHRIPGDWLATSRMMRRIGDPVRAKETLQRGLTSSPGNAALLAELQKL